MVDPILSLEGPGGSFLNFKSLNPKINSRLGYRNADQMQVAVEQDEEDEEDDFVDCWDKLTEDYYQLAVDRWSTIPGLKIPKV